MLLEVFKLRKVAPIAEEVVEPPKVPEPKVPEPSSPKSYPGDVPDEVISRMRNRANKRVERPIPAPEYRNLNDAEEPKLEQAIRGVIQNLKRLEQKRKRKRRIQAASYSSLLKRVKENKDKEEPEIIDLTED